MNKQMEYPHPVLSEYTNDYLNAAFAINILEHDDAGSTLSFKIECTLTCDGLIHYIEEGLIKPILRITCPRTLYRKVYDISLGEKVIELPKNLIKDDVDFQGLLVATQAINSFYVEELNSEYFGSSSFVLRKGDVVAIAKAFKIKLNTIPEKEPAGIVQVRVDQNATTPYVHYASLEDEDPTKTDYIYISLPQIEYASYAKLRQRKYMKIGIDRFIQSSLLLPALTEAVGLIRREEEMEPEDIEEHYKGTIWAESILSGLRKQGVEDLLSTTKTNYELANLLLGNVINDSINNLFQKMTEWSTIHAEDDVL